MRSLNELQTSLNDLRMQSKETFEIASQAQNSAAELKELREAVSGSLLSMRLCNVESSHPEFIL